VGGVARSRNGGRDGGGKGGAKGGAFAARTPYSPTMYARQCCPKTAPCKITALAAAPFAGAEGGADGVFVCLATWEVATRTAHGSSCAGGGVPLGAVTTLYWCREGGGCAGGGVPLGAQVRVNPGYSG